MKIKLALFCLVVISLTAFASVIAFSNLATPTNRISVNGLDISSHSMDSFSEWASEYINMPVRVSIDENSRDFSLHELGYSVDSSEVEEYFNSLTGIRRITNLISHDRMPLEVSVSINMRKMIITLMTWVDSIDPAKDATGAIIAFNEDDTSYYIKEHIDGSMNRKDLLFDVTNMITKGQDLITIDSTDYKTHANITSGDERLKNYVNAWNKILKTNTLNMGGGVTYEIKPTVFHSWLRLDFNSLEFTVDDDAIREFVYTLSKEFNTMGVPISFTTNTGDTIIVPGGDYGWWLNTAEMSKALHDLLIDPEVFELDAIWRQEGGSRQGNPIGNSYVEISLSGQQLWLYSDGELKHTTPIVTGKPASPTRRGVFAVTYTQRNGRLRGATWDVVVDYWMPFDGDIGMHDATWQSRFGGERYRQGYGSNGCVNLPVESAKIIFQYVRTGFPVVVY